MSPLQSVQLASEPENRQTDTDMSTHKNVLLPAGVVKFILENLEGFDLVLEDDTRIVLTPKVGAEISSASVETLAGMVEDVQARRINTRPRFIYKVRNASYTPKEAKAFNLSKPRLAVYTVIHAAGEKGIGYAGIKEKTKFPHGSVMQILNWLKRQRLITGKPEEVTS